MAPTRLPEAPKNSSGDHPDALHEIERARNAITHIRILIEDPEGEDPRHVLDRILDQVLGEPGANIVLLLRNILERLTAEEAGCEVIDFLGEVTHGSRQ